MQMVHRNKKDKNGSKSRFPSSLSPCMRGLSGVDAFFVSMVDAQRGHVDPLNGSQVSK